MTEEGTKIVTNEENQKDPLIYIKKLIDFKDKMDLMISEAFSDHINF